jgi:hypothetical protein
MNIFRKWFRAGRRDSTSGSPEDLGLPAVELPRDKFDEEVDAGNTHEKGQPEDER